MMLNIDFNRNHFLFLSDGTFDQLVNELKKNMEERGKTYRYVEIMPEKELKLNEDLLVDQPIGTIVVIAAKPGMKPQLVHSAREVGYPEADIFTVGDESQTVFCGSCHHISKNELQTCVCCPNCGCELDVSDHYSAYYDAVLGYPAIKKVGGGHG